MKHRIYTFPGHCKIVWCLGLAIFLLASLFSQESRNTIPEIDPAIFQQLLEKGEIRTQYYKVDGSEFSLFPKTELGFALNETWTERKDPIFVAESLFLIEKPEGSDNGKLDTDLISRIMRSISSMEGIEYYSNSEKRMKTLYFQSYTIDNPDGRNRIPDQVEGPADNLSVYAFQEDGSFGKNYYRIDYRQRENEVSMVIRLVEPLKFGFITAVKANNLVFNIDILDKGQHLVMYVGAKVNFPALSIFEERLSNSFGARITALHDWFRDNYLLEKQAESKLFEEKR